MGSRLVCDQRFLLLLHRICIGLWIRKLIVIVCYVVVRWQASSHSDLLVCQLALQIMHDCFVFKFICEFYIYYFGAVLHRYTSTIELFCIR